MKNNQETMSAAPEPPENRPPNSIRVIPLDGPNKGIPTYQSMDSAFAPIRREQLNWAEAEINRLRAELAKYEASGRIVDTTYRIISDPPKEGSEVTVYRIELNDEFRKICGEMVYLQRLCRSLLGKPVGKKFLDGMTAYLAAEYLSISKEEAVAKIGLAGEATDSVTAGIRTIRELVQFYEKKVTEIQLRYPADAWYAGKLRQLASCMNLKEYGMFLVCFTGPTPVDISVYRDLKFHKKFANPLSQFQLDWQFAFDLLGDYPRLIEKDPEYLIDFMTAVLKYPVTDKMLQDFWNELPGVTAGDSPEKEAEPLDERSLDVLEFCLENDTDGVSAKAMMARFNESSKSHFAKAVLTPLHDRGYLDHTCNKANSSKQAYRITQAGITALRQARPGRTYPEPNRTDSGAVPTVPDGKTE